MNSGLQDAVNLAWKLALVCHGSCSPALLDSYEAERRPVAEMVTASGDAVELAQMVADPAERRARDEALRAVFADPDLRHHEAIAEAELDIDYGNSPIVLGTRHDKLAPGQRLLDAIEVHLADGADCMLHELAYRTGHTALLIGGSSVSIEALAQVDKHVRARIRKSVIIEKNGCHCSQLRRSEFVCTHHADRSRTIGNRRDDPILSSGPMGTSVFVLTAIISTTWQPMRGCWCRAKMSPGRARRCLRQYSAGTHSSRHTGAR